MEISYDPAKNVRNIQLRDLPFGRAAEFDFATAIFDVDNRFNYGEVRYTAIGYLEQRLHVLCFLDIAQGIRVISFRKANKREVLKYEKAKTTD